MEALDAKDISAVLHAPAHLEPRPTAFVGDHLGVVPVETAWGAERLGECLLGGEPRRERRERPTLLLEREEALDESRGPGEGLAEPLHIHHVDPDAQNHGASLAQATVLKCRPRRIGRIYAAPMADDARDPAWVRWPVIGLAAMSGSWMLADGARAITTGDYVRIDGELGPWVGLLEGAGLDAQGTPVKIGFVVYGCAQLVAAVGYGTRRRWGRPAVTAAAAGSLWYLVLGTASGLVQLALLLAGRRVNLRS